MRILAKRRTLHTFHRRRARAVIAAAALASLTGLQGCADFASRPRLGLEWHLQNEAQKRELTQQGFDQYSPAP